MLFYSAPDVLDLDAASITPTSGRAKLVFFAVPCSGEKIPGCECWAGGKRKEAGHYSGLILNNTLNFCRSHYFQQAQHNRFAAAGLSPVVVTGGQACPQRQGGMMTGENSPAKANEGRRKLPGCRVMKPSCRATKLSGISLEPARVHPQ